MTDINLKRKVNLKRKGDTIDHRPEGKKPNKLIWLAVLGLVVFGGIFGIKQLNQSNENQDIAEDIVVSESVNASPVTPENFEVSKSNEGNNTTAGNNSSEQSDVYTNDETNSITSVKNNVTSIAPITKDANVAKDATSKDESISNENQSNKASVQGSVEDKAKQVIRGDFGNGRERMQALGSEYAVIQAKVNEMYKNGLFE
jgi:hypothetical protein